MNFFHGREEKKKERQREKREEKQVEKQVEKQIEQIILEKYNQYYRLAYSYVHNEEDAGDIVQNTAYRALKSCGSLKNAKYADTWIYRILLNEIFRMLKSPRPFSYEEVMEKTGNEGQCREDIYADVDLQRALNSLSDQDKLVIELRYFEEKKLEEIALILNENVSTVKSRLYRGIKKLRVLLDK